MRMSQLLGRRWRARDGQEEAESHRLLLRAGYVRQHAAGIYSYLSLGLRSLRKIEAVVREEMNRSGAQEILMSVVHSAESGSGRGVTTRWTRPWSGSRTVEVGTWSWG